MSIIDFDGANVDLLGYPIGRSANGTGDVRPMPIQVVAAGVSSISMAYRIAINVQATAIDSLVGTTMEVPIACINSGVNHVRVHAGTSICPSVRGPLIDGETLSWTALR